MRSVATLKAAYALAAALFTWLLGRLVLSATAASADPSRIAWAALPLGAAAVAVAWLGWALGRRLGLSPVDATAVALGSIMGGVNVAVLAWVLFTHAPPDAPRA